MPRSAPSPDDLILAQLRAAFESGVARAGYQLTSSEALELSHATSHGYQRLGVRAEWHRRSWRLSTWAATIFQVDLAGGPHGLTFRTTYARLTGQDTPWVQLLPGASEHETVQQMERLRAQCDEALFPWLDQVQTPAGLVAFMSVPRNSRRLIWAHSVGPFRPAQLVAALLPSSEAADAQAALQESERLTRFDLGEREQVREQNAAPAD